MRRTPLQFACLGFVQEAPASGYDMLKAVRKGSLRPFLSAGQAAIYEGLRALAAEGALTADAVEQSEKPSKIVYSASDKGRALFAEVAFSIARSTTDFRTVLLLFRFQDQLPADLLSQALAQHQQLLGQQKGEIEDIPSTDPLAVVFKEGAVGVLDAQIRWLDAIHNALHK